MWLSYHPLDALLTIYSLQHPEMSAIRVQSGKRRRNLLGARIWFEYLHFDNGRDRRYHQINFDVYIAHFSVMSSSAVSSSGIFHPRTSPSQWNDQACKEITELLRDEESLVKTSEFRSYSIHEISVYKKNHKKRTDSFKRNFHEAKSSLTKSKLGLVECPCDLSSCDSCKERVVRFKQLCMDVAELERQKWLLKRIKRTVKSLLEEKKKIEKKDRRRPISTALSHKSRRNNWPLKVSWLPWKILPLSLIPVQITAVVFRDLDLSLGSGISSA